MGRKQIYAVKLSDEEREELKGSARTGKHQRGSSAERKSCWGVMKGKKIKRLLPSWTVRL